MSQTTVRFTHKVEGVPTDVASAVLSDPTDAFGLRRLDTLAVVVANNTPLVKVSTGIYEYTFTDPAAGLTYQWYVEWVYGGETFRVEFNGPGGGLAEGLPLYVTLAEADELAGELPDSVLASYLAANATNRTKALKLATADIDRAMRYQGRRYDLSSAQVLEFPRVAYGIVFNGVTLPTSQVLPDFGGDVVWDWDEDAGEAVVPRDVKLACLHQANSILAGDREGRLQARADGLASQGVGSLSESYVSGGGGGGVGASRLCARALELMSQYVLRSGQML